jgi:hypothetical protein
MTADTSTAQTPQLSPRILVLGTADWNQQIATNQHYMTRELSKANSVEFVESLGLRKVEFSARDMKRIAKRLLRATPGSKQRAVPQGLSVIRPIVLPMHTGLAAKLNSRILRRLLHSWINYPGPRILWAYTPVTYGLESLASASFYHCVDLLGEFPGISRLLIEQNERRLALSGVRAIGSSDPVQRHLRDLGFTDVLRWPNVADVTPIAQVSAARPLSMRTPRAVFAGNFTTHKVDFELLNALLGAGIQLDLAGPVAEGGGGQASRELDTLIAKGAVYHGMLTLSELASLYSTATVGLIPYLINPYTHGVDPLKTYEYLSAGLSVVSTPIPAVTAQGSDVVIAETKEQFIAAVTEQIRRPEPEKIARRLAMAMLHSWDRRGVEARELIEESIRSASPGSQLSTDID